MRAVRFPPYGPPDVLRLDVGLRAGGGRCRVWTVLFTPPTGGVTARGEANPRRVTIAAMTDRTADVRLTVVRAGN